MATPGLIARLVQDTTLDQAHDALARLDAARARLSSWSPWRLLPKWRIHTVASRSERIRLTRHHSAVLDATVLSGGRDMLVAITVAIPLLDGHILRIQHRGRASSKDHPHLPKRTIDAIAFVLDHAEHGIRTAMAPDAEDGFEAIPARFDGTCFHSVTMPTPWNPARMSCSCGSDDHKMPPADLPHALEVWVTDHEPFSTIEIRTETVDVSLAMNDPMARLRAYAALTRCLNKDAA